MELLTVFTNRTFWIASSLQCLFILVACVLYEINTTTTVIDNYEFAYLFCVRS